MAVLQQSPIPFHSTAPMPAQISNNPTAKIKLSSFFTELPNLTFKLVTIRRRRVTAGASILDTAAESYASALSDVAKSNGTLDRTAADIEEIGKIFSDGEASNFFENPSIDDSKKREILDQIVTSLSLQPHVGNFMNILVDMKRMDIINDIVKEFEVFHSKLTMTQLAVVSSVVKLEPHHLAQVARGVQGLTGAKNVRIKTMIDPSLVAGITIRYGNHGSKLIDMSVKKQLEDIASQLEILSDVQL